MAKSTNPPISSEAVSEMIPEQSTMQFIPSAADTIFAKLPSDHIQQQVSDFCQQNNLGLEDGIVILLMRGIAPGGYFMEQIPGEAEQQKLIDYCSMENLTLEAAILSLVNRALEQPTVLEEARKSPFIAQAQTQLGTRVGASAFQVRTEKECEVCGKGYKPRNTGQRYCNNPECWASGAGLMTHEQRMSGQVSAANGTDLKQEVAELKGMFHQLMQSMNQQQRAQR